MVKQIEKYPDENLSGKMKNIESCSINSNIFYIE